MEAEKSAPARWVPLSINGVMINPYKYGLINGLNWGSNTLVIAVISPWI